MESDFSGSSARIRERAQGHDTRNLTLNHALSAGGIASSLDDR